MLMALSAALRGEGLMPAEYAGDCGIFSFRKPCGEVADLGRVCGEDGVMAIDGDLRSLLWLEEKLDAVDGIDVGVSLPDEESLASSLGIDTPDGKALDSAGLGRTGVRAFKNSVYATGGVIGVLRLSSSLIVADKQLIGLVVAIISEGKEVDLGVCNGGRTGFSIGILSLL